MTAMRLRPGWRPLVLFGLALMMALGSRMASGRELAIAPERMVEVEVVTVGMAMPFGVPVVLLREPGARAMIPVFIGPVEARAIQRGLRDRHPDRPLAHELLGDVLEGVGARLARVYIDDVVDRTFFGMLELRRPDREAPVHVDSRPSDAIALALAAGASIHVAPQVLAVAQEIDGVTASERAAVALGITVVSLDADLREALDLPDAAGLLVSDARGAAAEAGLVPGAILLEVNGETPESPGHFLELVRATPEGESVRLRYWQEGATREIELPRNAGRASPSSPSFHPPAPGGRGIRT